MAENVNTEVVAGGESAVKENKDKNKSKKLLVVITYVIALLTILGGLLAPMYGGVKAALDNMLAVNAIALLNNTLGVFTKTPVIPVVGKFTPNTWTTWTGYFDVNSMLLVLYMLLCLLAVVMLLPVCLGKKEKKTSFACAMTIEILVLIVSVAYAALHTYQIIQNRAPFVHTEGSITTWQSYNMLLPLGGCLLMAIVQSIGVKGGIGVSKTIAVILSVLGVVALLDITIYIPVLKGGLTKFSEMLKCEELGFVVGTGFATPNSIGFDAIYLLVHVMTYYKAMFANAWIGITYVLFFIVVALVLLNILCDIIGLATGKKFKGHDGREPYRNAASNTFAIIRYVLTFVFALALALITLFKFDDVHPGLYLYLVIVLSFIQLINAAVRTAVANARAKKGVPAPKAEDDTVMVIADPTLVPSETAAAAAQPAPEPQPYQYQPTFFGDAPVYQQPVYQQPVYQEPAPVYPEQPTTQTGEQLNMYGEPAAQQPAPEQSYYEPQPEPYYEPQPAQPAYFEPESQPAQPTETVSPLYEEAPAKPAETPTTVYIYGADSDEFMDTLTDAEKVEFAEVFLKKSKGKVNGVPDYKINQDNSDFFPAVFVHINRYRGIVSDALLGKLYKQLGKI